ncbi:hypothetical protein CIPAW_05G110800 [Carya illinoinensis]|uniref:Uncharacterized protein n=1 Tax=Carya illinoinensis TaxID=32201 RepID=A0A8T1QHX5_CARIL|nr:hypothetical protein CIPAW_05G110800 [Carya illinoinensis]
MLDPPQIHCSLAGCLQLNWQNLLLNDHKSWCPLWYK